MISVIACQDINGSIGYENKLLFKLSKDMHFFKSVTQGKTIVMGRNTYESIGKPLKDRNNIVISNTLTQDDVHPDVTIARSVKEVIDMFDRDDEIIFIGGESVYEEAMRHKDFDKAYLTTVIHSVGKFADTVFPTIPVPMRSVYTDYGYEEIGEKNVFFVSAILEKI